MIIVSKTTISLSTIEDVKNFVSAVTMCEYDVDLISGRYAIDAKSIMGIFSLDLSKPIALEAHTDDASKFFAEIKQYIIA
ncbi:MAG: HPr family phosphocarrier protein [Oscillospiraceae bacterium]|nr:HPr family phosphocarrier protein [Oscillospiraceae bacterium]